jgi:hypothetical protein
MVSLGIHQTILQMLDEVTNAGPSKNNSNHDNNDNDKAIDDLLSIIKLFSLHCPTVQYSIEGIVTLAMRNIVSEIADSRRIPFAEYLLHCSSFSTIISSNVSQWTNLYNELVLVLSSQSLLPNPNLNPNSSSSEYITVLLSSVLINLFISIPNIPLDHPSIGSTLNIIIESLRFSSLSPSLSPSNTESQELDVSMYKTLILKTASDSLSKMFSGKGKDLHFLSYFNSYFTVCLQSALRLAKTSSQLRSSEGVSMVTGGTDNSKETEGFEAQSSEDEGVEEALEAMISCLCSTAEMSASQLKGQSVCSFIQLCNEVLEVLYTSLTLSISATNQRYGMN